MWSQLQELEPVCVAALLRVLHGHADNSCESGTAVKLCRLYLKQAARNPSLCLLGKIRLFVQGIALQQNIKNLTDKHDRKLCRKISDRSLYQICSQDHGCRACISVVEEEEEEMQRLQYGHSCLRGTDHNSRQDRPTMYAFDNFWQPFLPFQSGGMHL